MSRKEAEVLTRVEIYKRVSKRTGHPRPIVENVVNASIDTITESIQEGIGVEIRKFLSINIRLGKKRYGRNPQRKEMGKDTEVVIPRVAKLRLSVGKGLDKIVKGLTPIVAEKERLRKGVDEWGNKKVVITTEEKIK